MHTKKTMAALLTILVLNSAHVLSVMITLSVMVYTVDNGLTLLKYYRFVRYFVYISPAPNLWTTVYIFAYAVIR